MKKIICLTLLMLFVLCGCLGQKKVKEVKHESFSYEEDYKYYETQPNVEYSGFKNTTKSKVKSFDDAIELAKKECTVTYDAIAYAYDSKAKVYRICFYTQDWIGGNQDVYINSDGITLFIAYGE